MQRSLFLIGVIFFTFTVKAQLKFISKDYFRWPVNNKTGIVANFGELRSNHWHMGLDIRTDQKVDQPVYAAASGYIARISVEPFGYGKAIYIKHPNGLTTVYGHLNKFFPKLDSLVTEQEYKRETWPITLDFDEKMFPVSKGQLIANSGTTGGSQGPHVHFEVRNSTTNRCINPFFFTLPIPDNVPPTFTKLAVYNGGASIYAQKAQLFPIKKLKNGGFVPKDTLIKTSFDKIRFGIGAYDQVSGTKNPNGIYSATIFLDEKPLIGFVLDSMDYNETDYINAHIDYSLKYRDGPYIQELFQLPGDHGISYRQVNGDGTISLNDGEVHAVKIVIDDIHKNASTLRFKLQYTGGKTSVPNSSAQLVFPPNKVNVFDRPGFEIYLDEKALYDTVRPSFTKQSSDAYIFGDPSVPIHNRINVRIQPLVEIPVALREKVLMKRTDAEGRGASYRKVSWQKERLSAAFSDFGMYQYIIDTTPPAINNLGKDTVDLSPAKTIVFTPRDNTGVKSFRAELDGQWLMFTNDKGRNYIYTFDSRCPYGIHTLKVRIEDIAGNVTQQEWLFKRNPYTPPPPKKKATKKKTTKKK